MSRSSSGEPTGERVVRAEVGCRPIKASVGPSPSPSTYESARLGAGVSDVFNKLVDEIVLRVKAEVLEELDRRSEPGASPWLSGAKAAGEYLNWAPERVYKAVPRLPHYREAGRLMFRKDELDRYVESC